MTGVVAAVEASNDVCVFRQNVNDLAFGLVARLTTYYRHDCHGLSCAVCFDPNGNYTRDAVGHVRARPSARLAPVTRMGVLLIGILASQISLVETRGH